MNSLAVVGAGSWGTALALALASRFEAITLWTRTAELAQTIARTGENAKYLAGFPLARNIDVSDSLESTLRNAPLVLIAVPSVHLRLVLNALEPYAERDAIFISATKGIEGNTLLRMSQVVEEALQVSAERVAVLSGPTFAREIAAGEPAAVVIASEGSATATRIQEAFSTRSLRFYTSSDVTGVELGAALKNVVAIGSGICTGLGLGSNSVAALVTRGLAEITRLAVALGAAPRTLSGLAGLGDLVLTATGDLSRNRQVGISLGCGRTLAETLSGMVMVAEGVSTCRAAHMLGQKHGVDLPIIHKMNEILYEGKDVRQAIRELMERPLTSE